MRGGLATWFCAAVVLGSSNASAQESGQFGLTMGYPSAIGVAWHATSRVGIRADVNFLNSSSELEAGPLLGDRETDSNSFGVGFAGLFYIARNDNVSTYFSPRFTYSRATSEIEGPDVLFLSIPEGFPAIDLDVRSESTSYTIAGSFGAQYSPIRRFSVFGELGLNYASQRSEISRTFAESEGSAFGVRSAVGVVLYFN